MLSLISVHAAFVQLPQAIEFEGGDMRRGQVAFVHFDHEFGLDLHVHTPGWICKVHTRSKSFYTTGNRARVSPTQLER